MQPTTYLLSNGGTDVLNVTVRRAAQPDADGMYELSLPFIDSGALLPRDRAFYTASAGDFLIIETDGRIAACAAARRPGGAGAARGAAQAPPAPGAPQVPGSPHTTAAARIPATAEILNVAVGKEWQGRGLGRLIMSHILADLAARQFGQALLFSRTTASWFGRLGFRRAEPGALPAAWLTAADPGRGSIAMCRPVTPAAPAAIRFARSGTERAWNPGSGSLLSFAEESGVVVDSLCWAGICGTCASPLHYGTVSYQVWPEGDPQRGEVLLCIAEPVTDLIIDR